VSRHMFHTTQCAECYDPERPTGPAEHDQLRYVNFREHIVLPDLGDYLLHNDGTFLAYLADLSPGIRAAARLQSEQLLNRNALRQAKIQKEAAFCVAEEIRRQSRRKRFKLTSPPSEASPSVASPLWGQSDSFWRCDVGTLLNLRGAGTCTTCGSMESQSSTSRLCGNSSCLRPLLDVPCKSHGNLFQAYCCTLCKDTHKLRSPVAHRRLLSSRPGIVPAPAAVTPVTSSAVLDTQVGSDHMQVD
jgi:hypothetical protein